MRNRNSDKRQFSSYALHSDMFPFSSPCLAPGGFEEYTKIRARSTLVFHITCQRPCDAQSIHFTCLCYFLNAVIHSGGRESPRRQRTFWLSALGTSTLILWEDFYCWIPFLSYWIWLYAGCFDLLVYLDWKLASSFASHGAQSSQNFGGEWVGCMSVPRGQGGML